MLEVPAIRPILATYVIMATGRGLAHIHACVKAMSHGVYTAEVIAADNVAFLCEVMDEIGRKDLTEDVKRYVERTEGESTA